MKLAKLLAKNLNAATEAHGSKTVLCRKAGMSPAQLDGYLKERNSPSVETLERLAEALEVPAWTLIRAPEETQGEKLAGSLQDLTPQDRELVRTLIARLQDR